MSEEEINYWLKVFSKDNQSFMSKDGLIMPLFKVFEQLKEFQHENRQLKEDYSKLLETSKAYKKLLKTTMQKEHQTIKVLDEIREYIEKDYSFAKRGDIPLLTKDEQLAGKLLQILDKVGSNE